MSKIKTLWREMYEQLQELVDSQIMPEDMSDLLDIEVAVLEHRTGCSAEELYRYERDMQVRKNNWRMDSAYCTDWYFEPEEDYDYEISDYLAEQEDYERLIDISYYDDYLDAAYDAEIAQAYLDEEAHYVGLTKKGLPRTAIAETA